MKRKFTFVLAILFSIPAFAQKGPDDYSKTLKQLGALTKPDHCPDPRADKGKKPASGPECESSSLFFCGMEKIASSPELVKLLQKHYRSALLTFFASATPAQKSAAAKAVGSAECTTENCQERVVNALASAFIDATVTHPASSASGTALTTSFDLASLSDFLSNDRLQKLLIEARRSAVASCEVSNS